MSHAPHDPTHPAPAAVRTQSRVLPLLGGALGLVGLIVGAAGCSQAVSSRDAAAPAYSEQQVADAKKAVCEAYERGKRSIAAVASRKAETPADMLPVAVNGRLGEVAVASYFLSTLESNPAAPKELGDLMRKMAHEYQVVAQIQLAEGTVADYQSNKDAIGDAMSKIDQICP